MNLRKLARGTWRRMSCRDRVAIRRGIAKSLSQTHNGVHYPFPVKDVTWSMICASAGLNNRGIKIS